jgi:DNA-binding XRE family transcriptional regulator
MTQRMPLLSESALHTKSSDFQYIEKSPTPSSVTGGIGEVIFWNFSSGDLSLPDGCVDIDSFVAQEEQDDKSKALIAEGRKWVAKTLYRGEPHDLKTFRLSKGLSQGQLAALTGTSQPHIARLENGTTEPQVSTVVKLAEALAINAEVLFKVFVDRSSSFQQSA